MALHGDTFASAHEFEYVPQKKKNPIQASPMPQPTRWPTSVTLKPCYGSKGVELRTILKNEGGGGIWGNFFWTPLSENFQKSGHARNLLYVRDC